LLYTIKKAFFVRLGQNSRKLPAHMGGVHRKAKEMSMVHHKGY
jgi:hypothetical protein